jgi:hypothetical protein
MAVPTPKQPTNAVPEEANLQGAVHYSAVPPQRSPMFKVTTNRFTYYGAATQIAHQPTARDVLQLFNPFAPPEYGNSHTGYVSWGGLGVSRSLPRTYRDPTTLEPQGFILIGVGF